MKSYPYYDFFEIPFSFYPDMDLIRKRFKANVVKNHPDLQGGALDAEQFTAQNNEAYKVLKNDSQRIRYILKQEEILKEGENEKLSPVFLMEMMELNEQLELASGEEKKLALNEIEIRKEKIWDQIETIGKSYDQEKSSLEEALTRIKDMYLQSKYMDRILKLNA